MMPGIRLDRKIGLFVFLLYSFIITFQQVRDHSARSIFPFFAWNLFDHVPQKTFLYILEVHEIDGQKKVPPINLGNAWKPFRWHAPSNFFPVPTDVKLAIDQGDQKKLIEVKAFIHRRFFPYSKSYRLVLIERSFDPFEYWRDGSKFFERNIASFQYTHSSATTTKEFEGDIAL
jgi:hypothetical protein